MSQSQKVMFTVLIFTLGIFFFLGKIRFAINPLARKMLLQQFIAEVKKANAIDPEKFWEFRDFYAATTSSFTPEGIKNGKPFLTFKTNYLQSNDFLLKDKIKLQEDTSVCPSGQVCNVQTLFRRPDMLIYTAHERLVITFNMPFNEMQKANGFFSYFGFDTTSYKEYYWYNKTVLFL